ncbi:Uncharacterised protein [Streptococcus pneumoniae]|uniref:hypothetical protein n=1 Tax=Bacilli TaxID=91061 RepID=UPI0001EF507A|nr:MULTISPECIES: hypothetical protein [Bacilli]EFS18410.1 hypothetical protein HMPREF0798_02087 [Staphylococcus hominis subsp. hominis C80]CIT31271.1 Uncharacterised protein [Streptococcus pneumoniae]
MKGKIINAIKDAIFIIIVTFIIAILLNFIGGDLLLNKFSSKLGHLEIVNIFSDNKINGLVTLGFILAIISFIYDMLFDD